MKEEIVELIIKEALEHLEEIRRLEVRDRISYLGLLIEDISGIPAIYIPKDVSDKVVEKVRENVKLN
jgi:hypothetical protein